MSINFTVCGELVWDTNEAEGYAFAEALNRLALEKNTTPPATITTYDEVELDRSALEALIPALAALRQAAVRRSFVEVTVVMAAVLLERAGTEAHPEWNVHGALYDLHSRYMQDPREWM